MPDLENIDPESGKAPETRVKDAASLNAIIKRMLEDDGDAAKARVKVQKMADGEPPFIQRYLDETGQGGRCNLNFGDGKARLKAEVAGYYDLTDSVPTLAMTQSKIGDPATWSEINGIMSEEFHATLKDWSSFDAYYQLLVHKFCYHGLGFLYFQDDLDWRWNVAGLDDFKVERGVSLAETDTAVAVVFREVPVGKLYKWIKDVPAGDQRWNIKEVRSAILNASDGSQFTDTNWEKWQNSVKNNDVFASSSARQRVKLAHVWVQEFDGRVSQYLTLQDGGNTDFLFKCTNRFDSVNQCFTYFPYEIGTNGQFHSTRGCGHEIYAIVQVLNALRCQTVDNAKFSGSLLIQPKTATDQEDLAIMFYAGAAYIPPNVDVVNGKLENPSQNILPIIQDMTLLMRQNSGDTNTQDRSGSQRDKTKFQVQSELTKESVLPTAAMDLFYQPWRRHLNEVWRRFQNPDVKSSDPGGKEILDFRKRCLDRGVPAAALTTRCKVEPVRAIGYGSPSNRLMALDEFMQYYGSLDPVGQNNLLRDRFAQKVGYAQVDRYVPPIKSGGRGPVDVEIAELQNAALSAGVPVSVLPNDHHIIHLQAHLPNLDSDLELLETGQGSPALLAAVQGKGQHAMQHMQYLKPDKLNESVVSGLQREYSMLIQRVQAAMDHASRQEAKAQAAAPPQTDKLQQVEQLHEMKLQHREQDHQMKLQFKTEDFTQRMQQEDAKTAAKIRAEAERKRLTPAT